MASGIVSDLSWCQKLREQKCEKLSAVIGSKLFLHEYENNIHEAEQALPAWRGAGRSSRGTRPLLSSSGGARSFREAHQAALQSGTFSQCPCRFVILATKEALYYVTSFETDTYIHRKYQYKIPEVHTTVHNTRYTHACGVYGSFSWSMAAGLLAFSSRQFALHNQACGSSLCPLHTIFSFLSMRSGWRMPPAERSALDII